jgi:hypothetical protein
MLDNTSEYNDSSPRAVSTFQPELRVDELAFKTIKAMNIDLHQLMIILISYR